MVADHSEISPQAIMNAPADLFTDAPAPKLDASLFTDEPAPSYSGVESFARGAANNFPLAPQAIAALEPGSYSQNLSEWNQKAAQAKAANPVSYGAGAVTGAVAPAFIPGVGEIMEASPILANAGLGAASAISNTDLLAHPGEAAKQGLEGGLIGGAVGKVASMLPGPETMLAKATSPEAVAAKLANPGMKATPIGDLAEQTLPKMGKIFDDKIKAMDDAARATLSKSHYPEEGAVSKDSLLRTIAGVKGNLSVGGGGLVGSSAKRAVGLLDSIADDIQGLGSNVHGTLKSIMGAPSITRQSDYVSQDTIKDVIQNLDANINWDDPAASQVNGALANLRTVLDDHLKQSNDAYREAMEPLSSAIRTRDEFLRKMSLKSMPGGGYTPSDLTVGKLNTALKDSKLDTGKMLDRAQEMTGEDVKTPLLLRQFEGPTPENPAGTASKIGAGMVGAALGHGLGVEGMGLGAVLGHRALHEPMSIAGRRGSEWILDNVMANPALRSFLPALSAAAQRGTNSLIANHFILMQQDPEYNKAFNEGMNGTSPGR
jgi:hypothetical protein